MKSYIPAASGFWKWVSLRNSRRAWKCWKGH